MAVLLHDAAIDLQCLQLAANDAQHRRPVARIGRYGANGLQLWRRGRRYSLRAGDNPFRITLAHDHLGGNVLVICTCVKRR